MTPGELLARVRRRAGLTQAEMARRAGTSQPVISAYEHGRRDPTISTLRRLLAAAGARLDLGASSLTAQEAAPSATETRARAARLVDALLLADAIPHRRRGELTFPRVRSS